MLSRQPFHFTCVYVVAATLQPVVAARATLFDLSVPGFSRSLAEATRKGRKGSSRPEKRPDSPQDRKPLSRAVKPADVVRVVAIPVMITPREILGGSVLRHSGWAVQSRWF